jgi:tRNA-specific 2-thiouridylase
MSERIVIAMSGGVDSSVAAARLVRQGYDVVGVTLHLWDYPDDGQVKGRCCAPEDVHDARRVADALGIPHYAFDRRELFRREVVDPFVESYLEGVTPSPCVRCNRGVKMHELFGLAARLGAARVATGHYARVDRTGGKARLLRARDPSKDQSYFLHMIDRERLDRLVFPLGDSTKAEVRAEAIDLGLPGAHKGESQELCFVPSGRYDAFVEHEAPDRLRPGPIVDEAGHEVGRHRGVHAFTVGQRKNLGVALGHAAYVLGLDHDTGVVRLGRKEALLSGGAEVDPVTLADDVTLPLRAEVAVRYRGQTALAEVSAAGSQRAVVHFTEPVAAVVPGQYAVFYEGERVLGGGPIRAALSCQKSAGRVRDARSSSTEESVP